MAQRIKTSVLILQEKDLNCKVFWKSIIKFYKRSVKDTESVYNHTLYRVPKKQHPYMEEWIPCNKKWH